MSASPTPRLAFASLPGAPFAAMVRVAERIRLDAELKSLVELRASQLNSCAYCIDRHWTEARDRGEPEHRLAQVSAWRESPYFAERERAALALTEAVTQLSSGHVPDDVWADAERHFNADELGHLLFAIAAINVWNRLHAPLGTPPASYAQVENPVRQVG